MAQTLSQLRGWRLYLALLAVAALVRGQTFGNPVVGFDEQFYLVVGSRMLHGALPFVDIFDRKPVGLFLIYAGIAALPFDATLAYQFFALVFAATTAFLIAHLARSTAPPVASLSAAIAYLLWLNFCEGEGGQSPVLYNLPMACAAVIVAAIVGASRASAAKGATAMLLVGIALQIKYSVVFEGIFLGVALLWAAWKSGVRDAKLITLAALWIAAALTPTVLAGVTYAALGHLDAWLFANFISMFGKLRDPFAVTIEGLAVIAVILLPLALFACRARDRFILGWLVTATLGMLAFGAFGSPHYALPVLVPLTVAAATGFGRFPRATIGLLALGLVGGQAVLALTRQAKGGAAEARAVAAAAQPRSGGCLYVYDGYPSLYRLVDSCVPTRYLFPGHLNTANEASARGLGVDPTAEVIRILASAPETIVIDLPLFDRGNRTNWTHVKQALAHGYHLTADVVTGTTRHRQVYRLNGS